MLVQIKAAMRTMKESRAAIYGSARKAETTVGLWVSLTELAVAWQKRASITTSMRMRFFIVI